MDPTTTLIPARSREQAMDWSLVLASQGIDVRIEPPLEGGGWALQVAEADMERAVESIRLYEDENRPTFWRRPLPMTGALYHTGALLWCLFLVTIWGLVVTRFPGLVEIGAVRSESVLLGEWWRLFTAVTLHQALPHLASNVGIGALLLGLLMAEVGPGRGLLLAFFCGVAGNVVSLLVHPLPHGALGASGMVLGALGLLAASSLSEHPMDAPAARSRAWRGVAGALMLLVLLGFDPASDVAAHVGGFAAGLVIGFVGWRVRLSRRRVDAPDGWYGAALVMVVGVTWWLALQSVKGH